MEDFDFSLEISDRDWECFFAECEECNLHPPSLARVDDSGMSDFDDSFLTQRSRKVDLTPSSPVSDLPVSSPAEDAGSPAAVQGFGKDESSGFESVLSGSEEDIHLQSVNIFFERLKDLGEADTSQETDGNNKVTKKEEQQVSGRTLPKSFPKSNTSPDRVENAFGKESQRPIDSNGNINTMKIVTAESNFFSEPETCSTSSLSFCKSPGTELYITEEDFTDSVPDDEAQYNLLHDSAESVFGSDTNAQSCRLEMWRSMDDIVKQDLLTSPETFCKRCSSREDQVSTPEGSQLVSMRRKRRKKRRLSLEAGEGGHPCERHSKGEQFTVKEERRLFLSTEKLDFKEQQKNLTYVLTPNPTAIKFPENFSAQEIKIELSLSVSPSDNQCQQSPLRTCAFGNYPTNHTPSPPLSQSDDIANDAADLQPNSEFQVTESPGLFEKSFLPGSGAEVETEKSESQKQEEESAKLQPSDERNVSLSDCENEQNVKHSTAEVKSLNTLPAAGSCALAMEVFQNDKLSSAMSDLATETGNSGLDKCTACQNDSEHQEQLESVGPNTNQNSSAEDHTHLSVHTTGGIISFHPKAFHSETLDEVIDTYLTSEHLERLPNESCLSGDISCFESDQRLDLSEALTSNVDSEKNKKEKSEILDSTSNIQTENEASQRENFQASPSDIMHVSSSVSLDAESVLSLYNENKFLICSSIIEQESDQAVEGRPNLLSDKEVHHASSGSKSQVESTLDLANEAAQVITESTEIEKPEKMPNSVFAMSSFWREMEKLTINDILGLRNEGKFSLPDTLPAVKESEDTAEDSGIYIEDEDSKLVDATEERCEAVLSCPQTLTWQRQPVLIIQNPDICPERTVLEPETFSSQPVLSERAHKCLKKISKTVSVHNLQALESESFSYRCKEDAVQILEEQDPEKLTYLTGTAKTEKDTLPSSSTNSYNISFADIFQYFFGGKESASSQSPEEDSPTFYAGGNSVPETYDHFFSEFDEESFFYPLLTAEEKNEDKPVPIFSYSRSTRNFQFPEAYEHFFASSSSDDSSSESEEEENCRPVKVVSRFSHKVNSTHVTTDIYENFFTDGDITGDLFSLSSLSFRKISFKPSTTQEGTKSLVPVRQSSRHQFQNIEFPVNALGNPDVMFPDPLLYHLEERISRQLALEQCRYEGLEVAVSNPRLDAPLLPLNQSDMCLVCIAFASWVLKTANPQIGDAWKAVLLANVSALSAIRYLRKYVKVEAAPTETRSRLPALTES
ncbi:PGC-1 and ERR-induced regulator in muscle protein 1 [Cyprinodon tularosa]|uniref:PGC-1 and ERR-induced regulator in muscle protein 1 n=1 Tax=Cyprinodon tularosa TaxID=77115 RepID=UPI0018E21E76|nr:PGC-1 and ERR-induced regulator in muscle protein 1 [Cyprinodon tularosa]